MSTPFPNISYLLWLVIVSLLPLFFLFFFYFFSLLEQNSSSTVGQWMLVAKQNNCIHQMHINTDFQTINSGQKKSTILHWLYAEGRAVMKLTQKQSQVLWAKLTLCPAVLHLRAVQLAGCSEWTHLPHELHLDELEKLLDVGQDEWA